jgi:UDP-N-acetylmuramoylalanine--D-glutamate ligase
MEHNHNTQKNISYHEQLIHARLLMQRDNAHHLEVVCEKNGVAWINHSMATTVDMTWFALRDIPGPAILIIGGVDRAEDHHKLKALVKEKVQGVVCMGSTPWKYFNAFRDCTNLIVWARDMEEAIDYARVMSNKIVKTVLFSPSCPSYDAFDNYKNRGNAFRKTIQEKIMPMNIGKEK